MKKIAYLVLGMLFTVPVLAQTDLEQKVTKLEEQYKQAEQKIVHLEAKVAEQTERNEILKEALDIRSLGSEITKDGVAVRITKVSQDLAAGEIRVEGLMTNKGTQPRRIQSSKLELVDAKGNAYSSYKIVKANAETEKFVVDDATSGQPYAFVIRFEGMPEKLATLALLRVSLYRAKLGKENFDFKGLEVSW